MFLESAEFTINTGVSTNLSEQSTITGKRAGIGRALRRMLRYAFIYAVIPAEEHSRIVNETSTTTSASGGEGGSTTSGYYNALRLAKIALGENFNANSNGVTATAKSGGKS